MRSESHKMACNVGLIVAGSGSTEASFLLQLLILWTFKPVRGTNSFANKTR